MKSVIIADDNKLAAKISGMIIGDIVGDVHVDLVDSSQSLVDKVDGMMRQGKLYDLVIVDYDMPGMNGLDAVRSLREMGYINHICMLTGCDIEREAVAAGVNAFLRKSGEADFKDAFAAMVRSYLLDASAPEYNQERSGSRN